MTTNVPLPTFSDAGLSVPTEPAVLTGVLGDWVDAFALSGKSLNTELTTPQGQLAQSQAYMLTVLFAGMAQIINGVDPATSAGRFQDALGRIYFLNRQPATYATVQALVTGVVGATLPARAQASKAALPPRASAAPARARLRPAGRAGVRTWSSVVAWIGYLLFLPTDRRRRARSCSPAYDTAAPSSASTSTSPASISGLRDRFHCTQAMGGRRPT